MTFNKIMLWAVTVIAVRGLWRSDEAREEVGIHAGLGLALCHKIVTLLGGSISAAAPESGLTEIPLPRGAGNPTWQRFTAARLPEGAAGVASQSAGYNACLVR